MDRPPRRLRFYKPDNSPPPPSESATHPTTLPSEAHHASFRAAGSTPVSRTTPETLRTLEANWRERRRARLEDITLQRAMGVESPAGVRTVRGLKVQVEEERGVRADKVPKEISGQARRTARIPLEPVSVNVPATENPTIAEAPPVAQKAEPSRNRRASTASEHPTVLGNNTTAQARTNKARKIVKLVRDARLSVQSQGGMKTRDSGVSSAVDEVSERKDVSEERRPAAIAPTSVLASGRLSFATASKKRPQRQAGTAATPRRVSELQSITHTPNPVRSSNRQSLHSPFSESSALYSAKPLPPITASPLPARTYQLSPTSSLIIYPYPSDMSIDTFPVHRQSPTMSALTGTERMDVFDGTRLRVKSSKTGETRWLELSDLDRWESRDRRRWSVLADLVGRLKCRTRRVRPSVDERQEVADGLGKATYDLPQGALHVMCNDPPDVMFYTDILAPPSRSKEQSSAHHAEGETSALLKATTDTAYLCRARILLSPSRATLAISTHYGPSTRDPPKQCTTNAAHGHSFRSRRIVHLSSPTHSSTVQQIEELYNLQKSAIFTRTTPAISKAGGFPQEEWQVREVQSVGRFLKVRNVWAVRDKEGG